MTRLPLFVSLIVLACGTSPERVETFDAPEAPDDRTLPRLVMNGPAPVVGEEQWLESWFTVEGFPAVSDDGKLVVHVHALADGARSYPNLLVQAYAVDNARRVFEAVLVSPDAEGVDYSIDAPLPDATLRAAGAAYAKARTFLASRRWIPLFELERIDYDGEYPGPYFSGDGELLVDFAEPALTIDYARWPIQLAHDFPQWSVTRDESACMPLDGDESELPEQCWCSNPARLMRAWADLERGVLLLDVGYVGTDTCWEPEDRLEPVALPKPTARHWTRTARAPGRHGFAETWEELGPPYGEPPDEEELARIRKFLALWERRYADAPEVRELRALFPR